VGRWRHRTHERDTVMNGRGPPTILPPSALHGKTTVAVTAERSLYRISSRTAIDAFNNAGEVARFKNSWGCPF
jgi:hypothetical protein